MMLHRLKVHKLEYEHGFKNKYVPREGADEKKLVLNEMFHWTASYVLFDRRIITELCLPITDLIWCHTSNWAGVLTPGCDTKY
jgi:hypothetical protein